MVLWEDDSFPLPTIFFDLDDVTKQIVRWQVRNHRIAFVKLYHPNELRKFPFFFHLFAFSILIATFFSFCFYRIFSIQKIRSIWFLLLIISLSVFYRLGPEVIASLRKFVMKSNNLVLAESCCTPAVIFPMEIVHVTANFFDSQAAEHGNAKDHILDRLPEIIGAKPLMTDRNLVEHIGMYSTLRKNPIHVEFLD